MNPETPHCVDKSRFDFGNLDWDAAWKALFFMPLERKAIDLCSSWKAAHGVLYTAHRLVLFGRLDVSLACFCGHPIETTERPFFIILRRRVVWFVLCSYLFLSSPMAPSISDRHVHFGFNDDELLCNPRLFCSLLSLLKFCLWRQRNDYHLKSKPPSAVGLIASIKGRLSFDSPLFFKHHRSRRGRRFFQRRWGANGYIGKVVGDSFLCF